MLEKKCMLLLIKYCIYYIIAVCPSSMHILLSVLMYISLILGMFITIICNISLSCCCYQVDNQLLGTTQPVMLFVTPSSSDSSVNDSIPALEINSVKVPSTLMLTELFKVSECSEVLQYETVMM